MEYIIIISCGIFKQEHDERKLISSKCSSGHITHNESLRINQKIQN